MKSFISLNSWHVGLDTSLLWEALLYLYLQQPWPLPSKDAKQLLSQAVTTKHVFSRHCEMFPGQQNHPLLRNTGLFNPIATFHDGQDNYYHFSFYQKGHLGQEAVNFLKSHGVWLDFLIPHLVLLSVLYAKIFIPNKWPALCLRTRRGRFFFASFTPGCITG